jgi:uncharacterized protein (DUF305 family)
MMKRLALSAMLLISTAAYADDTAPTNKPPTIMLPMNMPQMNMPQNIPGMTMAPQSTDTPATKDFKSGMAAMDQGMGQYTGNTDRDFVVNMIPHHQGAVTMAQTELKYGSDPSLKKLATDIVAAQEKEIAFMKAWLAKHPAP